VRSAYIEEIWARIESAMQFSTVLTENPLALRAAAFLLGIPLFALRAAVYKADKRERKK